VLRIFSMRVNARLDISHHGPPHPCKDGGVVWDKASTMRWCSASSLSTGAAFTRGLRCPHRYKSRGFKSGERGGHAMGAFSTCPLRASRTPQLKCAGAPSYMYNMLSAITHKLNISRHTLTWTYLLNLICVELVPRVGPLFSLCRTKVNLWGNFL
jgi:hypothetical protein